MSPGFLFPSFRRCTFREGERKVHQPDAFLNISPSLSTACRTPEHFLFLRWHWRLPGWQTASKQRQNRVFLNCSVKRAALHNLEIPRQSLSWLKDPILLHAKAALAGEAPETCKLLLSPPPGHFVPQKHDKSRGLQGNRNHDL